VTVAAADGAALGALADGERHRGKRFAGATVPTANPRMVVAFRRARWRGIALDQRRAVIRDGHDVRWIRRERRRLRYYLRRAGRFQIRAITI